jgi:fructokinase
MTRTLIGGIEGGGTKFVCVTSQVSGEILDETVFPTTTAEETLSRAAAFFADQAKRRGELAAIGLATFGPLGLNPSDPRFGHMLSTPKPGWDGADLLSPLTSALKCPVVLDTDVNGAGLGEARLGAGKGLDCIVYVTIGTGIGGGLIVKGRPVQGLMHPEMGHLKLRRHPQDLDFKGICPFHGDCLEGLVCGPALHERLGFPASEAGPEHPIWDLVAYYLGEFCASLSLVASPQKIILGGGVMSSNGLFPRVRKACAEALNGYVQDAALSADNDTYIVPPQLGARSGALGALLLAEDFIARQSRP